MKPANENTLVNIVDEFDYSTQNKLYNDKFIRWRRQNNNPFSFRFEMNKKETVYVDGRGFLSSSPTVAETDTLTRIFYIIGMACLIWVVIENILGRVAIIALSMLGVNIHNNFFSTMVYGGSSEIVSVILIISCVKMLIPTIYLHRRFKLPGAVEFMWSMNDPGGMISAIALSFIACTAVSLPTAYSNETREILYYFRNLETNVELWDQTDFVVYIVFDLIALPVLSELFFRGAMFAVLRQFGDAFAVIMTSLTAALLVQDIREFPIILLISMIASYGMLRSGTIFTAIAVRVIEKMYMFALLMLEIGGTEKTFLNRNLFMLAVLVIGILFFVVEWLISHRKKQRYFAKFDSELTPPERISHCIKVFPYSAVLMVCMVYIIVRAVL